MSDDIVELIDGALRDYTTSTDAMRWAPEPDEPNVLNEVAAEFWASGMQARNEALRGGGPAMTPAERFMPGVSDPLGLTPEQRAWSDASEVVDAETPSWWTLGFRDAVMSMRVAEELRRRQILGQVTYPGDCDQLA